ncbi:MAG: cysteine--tRNA ligase [SAR202 cluster bacterium]|nr:cysteine--tRNA ligase [SAR202 cluster bacterium]|tara:strand:- start:108 stop:2327 length:2220 start_codon:yes stop_codon:yes gene_type:complete
MELYNTLNRKKEEFHSITPGKVSIYTCGPTVYRYIHIGNLRAFLTADLLRRSLAANGFEVEHIKNITDVGHMRQEALEQGGDKMILAALAEGKTSAQIAEYYTEAFRRDEDAMNILPAQFFPKATDHVPDMINMVEQLIIRNLAYVVEGNVYFDVERYSNYGKLSGNALETLLEGVRIDPDPLKKNQIDFTLWKLAEDGREMKWNSPWGEGFPGWHIECSAMSTRYLGETFDIHTGGVDNIFPHHEGEIAQSEGALGHEVVRYWTHSQHLLVDGLKMAKSTGNSYTLSEIEDRGFDPLAFRYLCFLTHYRNRMNFTFPGLIAAQSALDRLRNLVIQWTDQSVEADDEEAKVWRSRFWGYVDDDLNMPRAVATMWQMAQSKLNSSTKLELLEDFDRLLGLELVEQNNVAISIPTMINETVHERNVLRQKKDYLIADDLRAQVHQQGYEVEDTKDGTTIRQLQPTDSAKLKSLARAISGPDSVESRLAQPSTKEISVIILAHDYPEDVQRCVTNTLKNLPDTQAEVIVVENGTTSGLSIWLDDLQKKDQRLEVLHVDHALGEGAGKNTALKSATGKYIVGLDLSVAPTGDLFSQVIGTLQDPSIGLVGRWGLRSYDLRHFDENESGEVDAMQAYCYAFRREDIKRVGLFDEKFRFYRNLDIDLSMQFRSHGFRVLALPELNVERFEHKLFVSIPEGEVVKQSQKNFNRVLRKWGDRAPSLLLQFDPDIAHEGHDHDDDDHD